MVTLCVSVCICNMYSKYILCIFPTNKYEIKWYSIHGQSIVYRFDHKFFAYVMRAYTTLNYTECLVLFLN